MPLHNHLPDIGYGVSSMCTVCVFPFFLFSSLDNRQVNVQASDLPDMHCYKMKHVHVLMKSKFLLASSRDACKVMDPLYKV